MNEFNKRFYANKFENLDEIHNFLETDKLLMLTQIKTLNKLITTNEKESIINSSNTLQKTEDSDGFRQSSLIHEKHK